MTRPYAEVIGDPIGHSKSPLIHNFWLGKLGIDAEYRAERVTLDTLHDYLAKRRRDPAWRGCNVTMPLKQYVAPLVDAVDPLAARVGAINTIVAGRDGLSGCNSDVAGFIEPLAELVGKGGQAALYGTGGAARAIAVALADAGFRIVIHGRTAERAHVLAAMIGSGIGAAGMSDPTFLGVANSSSCLIVNATSLGMIGQPPLPISLAALPPTTFVYDIVTSPRDTPLLIDARARGMCSFDGLQMLIGQAAVAFGQFFGEHAPRECDAELRERLMA